MQEHAEGPRSKPLKVCHHCGATLPPDTKVCPKCEAPQVDHPADAPETRPKHRS